MSRSKKSRKIGTIGARKSDKPVAATADRKSAKDRKGKKPGARNAQEANPVDSQGQGNASNKDARVGSKTKIDLVASEKPKVAVAPAPVAKSAQPKIQLTKQKDDTEQREAWQQELEQIENSEEINELLEAYENDQELTANQLAKLNKTMARHQSLMEKLGLNTDETDEDELLLDEWENSENKGDW